MPTVYLWEYWWSCVPFCYTLEEVKSLPQVNKNLFGWKHLNLFLRIFTKPCFSLFYDWSSFRVLFSRYSFCIIFLSFSSIEKKHGKWYITIVWTQLEKKQHFYTMKKQPFGSFFTTQNTKFTRITKCTFIRTTTLHSTTLTALVESSYFPGTCHITTQQPQLYVHRDI